MTKLAKLPFFERINQLPCLNCWSRDPPVQCKEDYLEHYGSLLEFELRCSNCGAFINHWAYGYFEHPETWTGLFRYQWNYYTKLVIPRAFISHWGYTYRSPEYTFICRYPEDECKPTINYH